MTVSKGMTLTELIAAVREDQDLGLQRQRNLVTSINKFVEVMGGNGSITASFPVVSRLLKDADFAALGLSPRRRSNIKSDLNFALKRFAAPTRAPLRKDLTPAWSQLRDLLDGNERLRRGLSSFIHFCSAKDIEPDDVCDETFLAFQAYLKTETLKQKPEKTFQNACKLWNDAVDLFDDWPQVTVTVPSFKRQISFPWEAFPKSFRDDIDAYVQFMGRDNLADERCVAVPRKSSTLEHHRHQIRRWASALVHDGFPMEELIDLSILVAPENMQRAMRYYIEDWSEYDDNREEIKTRIKPSHFEMAATMVVIAKEYVEVDEKTLEDLKTFRDRLKCRKKGFTTKNRDRLRAFWSPQNQYKFLNLGTLLVELADQRPDSPKSHLLIQKALAHEMLLNAPVRFGNLVGLNIHDHIKHVKKGWEKTLTIAIPEYEVKNEQYLVYQLPTHVAELYDRYMTDARPHMVVGEDAGWLFPGKIEGRPKHEVSLRENLTKVIRKHTGLIINPHLYRHIAAFFYLQAHPGDYETVKLLLGHKSVETTMEFYAEFEAEFARKLYTDHIIERKDRLEGDREVLHV